MEIPKKVSLFPVGDKLPEQFSKYFVGQAGFAPLTDDKRLNAPVSNVTFFARMPQQLAQPYGRPAPDRRRGPGLLSEEGPSARALLPATSWRSRPTWSTGTARLPDSWCLASGRRVQSRDQREYMARTGRRRAICGSDGFRPGPGLPAWVKTPDAAWPNCFRAEYRNLGMRTPNYLKFL